jgi:HAD superfamily hydrolase (TIGR01509 family)
MDGVLIDAREWHFESLNSALGLFGFKISREEHLSTYDGLPTSVKLKKLTLERDLPERLHSIINSLKQRETMKMVAALSYPIYQHEYLLSRLKSEGYKLGLASNSIRSTVEVMLHSAGIWQYFDAIVTNEDVIHAKPAPDPYLRVCELLETPPSAVLVVEDNQHGVDSAKAAGCHVFRVRNPTDVNWANISQQLAQL